MNKCRLIFEHTIMISAFILVAIAIQCTWTYFFTGREVFLLWYHLISIPLAGFCCALPSLLWIGFEERKNAKFLWRLILHVILVYAVVVVMGWVFDWYDDRESFLFVTITYVLIYASVWLASLWMAKQDDKRINEALKDIQDSE